VRALLDTNAFLWLNRQPERLGDARDLLADPDTEILVSAVVAWEIAIKFALGRLELPSQPLVYVPDRTRLIGGQPLAIEHRDVLTVTTLAHIHRDPFDRLLVAQAIVQDATLVTGDRLLAEYPADVLVV
jgi:PIN domain nuclease of toxin-antitoxin system